MTRLPCRDTITMTPSEDSQFLFVLSTSTTLFNRNLQPNPVQQPLLVKHNHRHRIPDPLLLPTNTFKANCGGDGCKFHIVQCEACVCIAVVMSDFSCCGALKETLTFQHQSLQDTQGPSDRHHLLHGRHFLTQEYPQLLRLQSSALLHLILKSALICC